MSSTKQRVLAGAGLSALVLVFAGGLYLSQPTSTKAEATKAEQSMTSSVSSTSSSSTKPSIDKEVELVKEAEKAVVRLEKNQIKENLEPAQKAVDVLKKGETKDKLQKRIDLVKLNMAHKAEQARLLAEAERLVKHLEDNQVNENVQPAQDEVDKVRDVDKKAALQHRIELVKQAIAAREAEAAAQAAAQAAQAQQSGYTQGQDVTYQAPVQTYQTPAPSQGTSYSPPAGQPGQPAGYHDGGGVSTDTLNQQVDDANSKTYVLGGG